MGECDPRPSRTESPKIIYPWYTLHMGDSELKTWTAFYSVEQTDEGKARFSQMFPDEWFTFWYHDGPLPDDRNRVHVQVTMKSEYIPRVKDIIVPADKKEGFLLRFGNEREHVIERVGEDPQGEVWRVRYKNKHAVRKCPCPYCEKDRRLSGLTPIADRTA